VTWISRQVALIAEPLVSSRLQDHRGFDRRASTTAAAARIACQRHCARLCHKAPRAGRAPELALFLGGKQERFTDGQAIHVTKRAGTEPAHADLWRTCEAGQVASAR